jgi:hypothetical protein
MKCLETCSDEDSSVGKRGRKNNAAREKSPPRLKRSTILTALSLTSGGVKRATSVMELAVFLPIWDGKAGVKTGQ